MEIHVKKGVDKAVFGMRQKDITAIYGKPDRQYTDDENNVIYLYNKFKMRLTFYDDEELRLGYIIVSGNNIELAGKKVTGRLWNDVAADIPFKQDSFEKETFDSTDNYFNEANWIIFQVEFDEVVKVELGALINDKDEFEWKFKG